MSPVLKWALGWGGGKQWSKQQTSHPHPGTVQDREFSSQVFYKLLVINRPLLRLGTSGKEGQVRGGRDGMNVDGPQSGRD